MICLQRRIVEDIDAQVQHCQVGKQQAVGSGSSTTAESSRVNACFTQHSRQRTWTGLQPSNQARRRDIGAINRRHQGSDLVVKTSHPEYCVHGLGNKYRSCRLQKQGKIMFRSLSSLSQTEKCNGYLPRDTLPYLNCTSRLRIGIKSGLRSSSLVRVSNPTFRLFALNCQPLLLIGLTREATDRGGMRHAHA